jgi:hypothetical protein
MICRHAYDLGRTAGNPPGDLVLVTEIGHNSWPYRSKRDKSEIGLKSHLALKTTERPPPQEEERAKEGDGDSAACPVSLTARPQAWQPAACMRRRRGRRRAVDASPAPVLSSAAAVILLLAAAEVQPSARPSSSCYPPRSGIADSAS